MRRRDKIETLDSAFGDRQEKLCKLVCVEFLARAFSADRGILTENASEIAAREEYSSRASLTAYRGLLVHMTGDARDHRLRPRSAEPYG